MIAIVVAAACVFLVALAGWSRRSAARAERRSVREYGKTLGVLADVSKRSEQAIRLEHPNEVAGPHVHQSEAGESMRPAPNARVDVPPARLRLHPPSMPSSAGPSVPAAEERAAPSEVVPIVFDDAVPVEPLSAKPGREIRGLRPGRDHALRRAATGAAAAVVVGALAVGGYELVATRSPTPAGGRTDTTNGGSPGRSSTTTSLAPTRPSNPTASTTPSAHGLQPTSKSASFVAYAAPAGAYTITFTTSSAGACWIGVETSAGSSFVWQDTLTAASTVTYRADGPVVVRIGNPQALKMLVNGEHVDLPAKNVLAYDIALTPAGQATA